MAEWKQTLEPYIKVQERVMTTALNPTVGEDLIVGVVIISDAGSSDPTLISGQKEFLENYASKEVNANYLKELDNLYSGELPELASTMWANAYRLAGSTRLLCVRASKAENLFFMKPFSGAGENDRFILKDGEILKKVGQFKFVIDDPGDLGVDHNDDGWSINVRGIGRFGNRVTDTGAAYDYFASDLIDLIDKLNETSKFFSPSYKFYTNATMTTETTSAAEAKCVVFEEVYLAQNFLETVDAGDHQLWYLVSCELDWTSKNDDQKVVDLNSSDFSDFEEVSDNFAINVYNSKSDLKVRIRRFNHDAVTSTSNYDKTNLTESGKSPYNVLTGVLDAFTKKGTEEPSDAVLYRDFFEVAVLDPSTNSEISYFNVGNIRGRGDLEVSEINDLLKMISLELPDDLHDLKLGYYGYTYGGETANPSKRWKRVYSITGNPEAVPHVDPSQSSQEGEGEGSETPTPGTPAAGTFNDLFLMANQTENTPYVITVGGVNQYYVWTTAPDSQSFVELGIPDDTAILNVSDSDLLKAMDKIQENEVYMVEGLSDLGNTNSMFQNYLINLATSEDGNYFYPISPVNSTNYMTIGTSASRFNGSYKTYCSAPWDIDTNTLGFRFAACPSVIYWEGVAQNYKDGRPYASLFGQTYGKVNYQRPACEFNRKQRELLLSKKVNTVMWNTNMQLWQMNDNYTMQVEDTIMNDEGNVRMGIHIAKVQPQLLAQFIGKKVTERLCADVRSVERYWINNNIMNLSGNAPEEVQVFCDYDEELARKNQIRVVINVRFSRALKFVNVVDRYFDTGMDISSAE